ncbi:MAG: glycogen/starch/alpha-glucan phosphorylase [Clostridiales Family XIII bacterium]|jgi:starch phosphorylase|nr:glycogen/starch/alpha-glucan phosphorylase [Clostridiales Family XIII bacterium]
MGRGGYGKEVSEIFKNTNEFIREYRAEFADHLGKAFEESDRLEQYTMLVRLIRRHISRQWVYTNTQYGNKDSGRQIYYFSMEFLIGKLLCSYLTNLGISEIVGEGLSQLGVRLSDLFDVETDAGLGNGGLGRLAACFLDSMAFLGMPGHGNGIRYRFGLFRQKIVDGQQVELPDNWLQHGYPWEIRKPEKAVVVRFNGNVSSYGEGARLRFRHENYDAVLAVPYDVPVIGYARDDQINTLRLWSAEQAGDEFDFASFNRGDYAKALHSRSDAEAISYVLYPNDDNSSGQELRLKQEYFLVAAGVGAIVARFKKKRGNIRELNESIAIHINDTHPALCVAELMRILVDEEGLGWNKAWTVTVNTISFTNHTVMPEALECWPEELFRRLLPRIHMIITEIDRRHRMFLESHAATPGQIASTAIIRDGKLRMVNLAVIGSHTVNGVAALHTEILKRSLLRDFYANFPYKFRNETNGVSHRRFLLCANPGLSGLISECIGDGWIKNFSEIERMLDFGEDSGLLRRLAAVKRENKKRLAGYILDTAGIRVDPDSVFDVHVKRIHGYKRQILNLLKIMSLYNSARENPGVEIVPATFIFAGKAAPGYHFAKTVIHLICKVADRINSDPAVRDLIKVVFLENFNVTIGELIYPAADISEQISIAGKEASGTGNMKQMMNGAITLGTLDGANVEIRDAVGEENMALFGLKVDQVMSFYSKGGYLSWDEYHADQRLKRVVDQLIDGFFPNTGNEFKDIYDGLLRDNDEYFVLKDFDSYMNAFGKLNAWYRQPDAWNRISLHNIARSWPFTSDETVRRYGSEIWDS